MKCQDIYAKPVFVHLIGPDFRADTDIGIAVLKMLRPNLGPYGILAKEIPLNGLLPKPSNRRLEKKQMAVYD